MVFRDEGRSIARARARARESEDSPGKPPDVRRKRKISMSLIRPSLLSCIFPFDERYIYLLPRLDAPHPGFKKRHTRACAYVYHIYVFVYAYMSEYGWSGL